MHDGSLAIFPYIFLTIDALLTGALFAAAVVLKVRRRFMLIGAASMALIGLFFASLAVTAGPAPVVERGALADVLRTLAAVAGPVWLTWLALYARSLIVIERK